MTRQRYLFDLAAVTHIAPPAVNGLAVIDFAQLLAAIDQHRARTSEPGRVTQ